MSLPIQEIKQEPEDACECLECGEVFVQEEDWEHHHGEHVSLIIVYSSE